MSVVGLEYRCPQCGWLAFKAGAFVRTKIEIKCRGCGGLVEPVPQGRPRHVEYECTRCLRSMHVENPVSDRVYCVVCGTATLVAKGATKVRPQVSEAAIPLVTPVRVRARP
jgi:ribosomal protein S27E